MASSAASTLLRPVRIRSYTLTKSTPSQITSTSLQSIHNARPRTTSPYLRPLLPQCRHLSTSPALSGGRAAGHTIDRKRGKMEACFERKQLADYASTQSSIRARMRSLLQSDEIPSDLGLFPATLIMPIASTLPGILTQKRWKMEYQRLKKRFQDFLSLLVMKWTVGLRKHKIGLRKTAPTAMALHRQVYAAFADGDQGEIREVTTEGVRDKLIAKIQGRPAGVGYYWDLVRYLGRPRVVSHRATQMPIPQAGDEPSMLRQAVVRVGSVQRLVREDRMEDEGDGVTVGREEVEPEQSEKEVVEYVVIQKRVLRGVEEPWKFWGTVEPTKVEDFEEALVEPQAPEGAM